jgi:hypothetical protein
MTRITLTTYAVHLSADGARIVRTIGDSADLADAVQQSLIRIGIVSEDEAGEQTLLTESWYDAADGEPPMRFAVRLFDLAAERAAAGTGCCIS